MVEVIGTAPRKALPLCSRCLAETIAFFLWWLYLTLTAADASSLPGLAVRSRHSPLSHPIQTKSSRISFLPKFSKALVRGGTSRALAQALLYPVDALRTLAQTRDARTLADVGINVLVRGCFTTSSFALLQGAIQFGVFGVARDRCGAVVASVAGASASCLVSVPEEIIKQRLVTGVYESFPQAVASIYRTDGLAGFYSAWRPTVSRNVPFVIITLTSQDFIQSRLLLRRRQRRRHHSEMEGEEERLSLVENMVVGMASALMACAVTNPIDVIKTRMMTQAASTATPYTSALDCALTILRNEGGVGKFYAGFGQRSVYLCGLWGVIFTLKGYMQRREDRASATLVKN